MTTSVKTENLKISSVESGRTTEKRLFSLLTDDPTQKEDVLLPKDIHHSLLLSFVLFVYA